MLMLNPLISDLQVEFFNEEHPAPLAERVRWKPTRAVSGKQSTDHRLTITSRPDCICLIPHSLRRHGSGMPDLKFSHVVSIAPAL